MYRGRTRSGPRFHFQVFSSSYGVSHTAAQKVLDIAKTGRGTVVTPGCNTPMEMYQILSMEGETLLPPLLRGEKGDFHMGMIDGVEWNLEHPFSFRHYFINQFLGAFLDVPFEDINNPQEIIAFINNVYKSFPNVFVPHLPRGGGLTRNMTERIIYSAWVIQRSPINLGIFGLGPDHFAFIGPGSVPRSDDLPARRVELWGNIRKWKWRSSSFGACSCAKLSNCGTEDISPEHALTMTLRTILGMEEIVIMAMGRHKAEAVRKLLYGAHDPENFPPHYLSQASGRVTVLLDEAAAFYL